MPTATGFTSSVDWNSLIGVFNAIIRVFNPALALIMALMLALGAVLLVLGAELWEQNKDTAHRKHAKSGRKFIVKKPQHPPLTLWQQIACLLFPGFRARLAKQRYQRPPQKNRVIPLEPRNNTSPASSSRSKSSQRQKPKATSTGRKKQPTPPSQIQASPGLPGSMGQATAQPDIESDPADDDALLPARYAFGLPVPQFDLEAALASLDQDEQQAQLAQAQLEQEAAELQQEIRPGFGLPLPDVEQMIDDQTRAAYEEQVQARGVPPAASKTQARPAAKAKAAAKPKAKKSKTAWKTDLDTLLTVAVKDLTGPGKFGGSTPYDVADFMVRHHYTGPARGKNKARGEFLSRLQVLLQDKEAERRAADAGQLNAKAAELQAEGWRFIESEAGGGFWLHPASGASINRLGAGFASYEEATEHAYNSPVRQLKQVQAAQPDPEPAFQYETPIGPEPLPPAVTEPESASVSAAGQAIGAALIDLYLAEQPPILHCPFCNSHRVYGNGGADLACPDCGEQFHRSQAKKSKQKRAKATPAKKAKSPKIAQDPVGWLEAKYGRAAPETTESVLQYAEPIGPEPDPRLQYESPIGPEPDPRLMYATPAGPPRPPQKPIIPAKPKLAIKDRKQAKIFEAALDLSYVQLAGWVDSHDYDTLNSRKAEFVDWLENAYRSGRTLTAAAKFNSVEHAWDVWQYETTATDVDYPGQQREEKFKPPTGQASLFAESVTQPAPTEPAPKITQLSDGYESVETDKGYLSAGGVPIKVKQIIVRKRPAADAPVFQYDAPIGPEPAPPPVVHSEDVAAQPYRLEYEGDWTWLKFAAKPSAAVLSQLKSSGARWSKKRRAWYYPRQIAQDWFDTLLSGSAAPAAPHDPISNGTDRAVDSAGPNPTGENDERSNPGVLPERIEHAEPAPEPGADHSPALAAAPAPDVPTVADERPSGTIDPGRGPVDGGSSLQSDRSGSEPVRSLDGDPARVGDPALGGGTAGAGQQPGDVDSAGAAGGRGRLSGDYRITEADLVGLGGAKQKYRDNVAAIRLLKQLEAEGRQATPAEQAVLVKYVGWGGLPKVFDPYETYSWNKNAQWRDEYTELRSLLTDEEYSQARGSTANAHYTAPNVINAMWQGLQRMGFAGGKVLEPAAGVGHFFGLMPDDIAANSQKIATELDPISGRITQQLYQSADVRVAGFEESNLPNNFIDLAISNVPFGNYAVHDPAFKRERKFLTRSIHNYFFAKALDKVKPGGMVAFVTSRFTLDSKDSRVREYLASQADLVGAIRLPNTAFKENAMTDVTTDIIFLRKRAEGEKPTDTAWVGTVEQTDETSGKSYRLNEYFTHHPAMMLGQMQVTGNMYRESADLVPDERDLSQALAQAIEQLPADVLRTAPTVVDDTITQPPPFYERRRSAKVERIREGSYFVGDDSRVYRRQNGFDVVVETGAKSTKTAARNVERIRGLAAIREAARNLLELNLSGAGDAELEAGQAQLNAVYDAFTGQHGPISQDANKRLIKDDPDLPFLLALERYDRDSKTAHKAAIFRDRVIGITERPSQADSAKDALLISLNEYGDLHWERMEELTGKSQADLTAELGDILYLNPEGGWETAETYLSGNIRRKLAAAEAAAALEPLYQRNIEALRQALPRDLAPHEIWVNMGAGWVPDSVVEQFVRNLLSSRAIKVRYIEDLAQWTVDAEKWAQNSYENSSGEWATSRATVLELVESALNAKTLTIYDYIKDADGNRKAVINQAETVAAREKQAKIKAKFAEWVWADPDRASELAAIYNEQFNAVAPQKYDGSHLNLPGTAADITLRGHQKDAIWRIIQGSNALLAHQVGAGKTFTMIAAGMELRRLGLRNKVMHIVLNSTLDQYAADFQRLYPGARVLVLDAEAVSPAKRKETMSRIATEDWDAIITSHTSFEKLPVQDETFNAFLREQIDVLSDYLTELRQEDEKENRKTIKELEKAKKRLEAKLRDKKDAKDKDDALTWEELGVDHLFVDEAHKFKNLYFPTKRGRVAGIGGSESGRAFDLFIKTRGLAKKGGLTLSTGTPIANSVSEMYTMQRYLQYDQLKEQGLGHFDAWANMFGDTVTAIEMKPTGSGYRQFTRFAKFNNVPELLRLYHQVADVQMDLDALGIVRPKLEGHTPVSVEPSERLQEFIKEAEGRAENLGSVDPRQDNMLKIVSDANKAALDMRLIDVELPDDPNSKVNALVDRVTDIYQRTSGVELAGVAGKQNLTQLIFLDTSTPGDKGGFSVYQDIKDKLVKAGIPAGEVAFIHDAATDEQKLALFERVNKGDIRVLLGSTEKAGTGVNVQRLLYALHHLDAPWRPADIEQREGRILRQGNLNKEVEIYRYVTEGSFDVYKWQTLETKAKFISQINSGDMDTRSIEDIDAAVIGYAEMKAIASGNPVMMEKIKLEADLRKYEGLFNAWQNRRYELQRDLRDLPQRIERAKQVAASYRGLLATREREGVALLEGVGAGLTALAEQAVAGPVAAGKVFGRPASVQIGKEGPQLVVNVAKGVELGFRITSQDKRNVAKLQDLFGPELEARLGEQERLLGELERTRSGHQTELDKPFEHAAALDALRQRKAAIQAEIDAIEAGQPEQVFDESTFGPDSPDKDEDSGA